MVNTKYKVSEISRLLGVSSQMIRNYEKEGLLEVSRLESNYRYYEAPDLTRLILLRKYRSWGFSLDELKQMIHGEVDTSINCQKKCISNIDSEIERLLKLKEYSQFEIQKLEEMKLQGTKIQIEKIPKLKGFFYRSNRAIYDDFLHSDEFSEILKLVPPLQYVISYSKDILERNDAAYQVGFVDNGISTIDFPESLDLFETDTSLTYVTVIVRHIINKINYSWERSDSTNDFVKTGVLTFLDSHEMKVQGNIIGIKILDQYEHEQSVHYIKYWIPVLTLNKV